MRVPYRKDAFHALPSSVILNGGGNQLVTASGSVWKADAVELVKSLPDESVDLVVTDPAYESLEKWRALGSTTRLKESKGSSNKWFQTFPNRRYFDLFAEFYRVLKPGSHLYMFCDEETRDLICTGYSPQIDCFIDVRKERNVTGPLMEAGFKYWKAIIWDKQIKGMGYHYPAQHEFIIFAEKVRAKGKHRRLNTNMIGDVISVPRLKGKNFYPTEKPQKLIHILVTESSNKGDTVLDPFCGSGVVGYTCQVTERKYILGDIDPEEAMRRLK